MKASHSEANKTDRRPTDSMIKNEEVVQIWLDHKGKIH